jgi:hypothetical protein
MSLPLPPSRHHLLVPRALVRLLSCPGGLFTVVSPPNGHVLSLCPAGGGEARLIPAGDVSELLSLGRLDYALVAAGARRGEEGVVEAVLNDRVRLLSVDGVEYTVPLEDVVKVAFEGNPKAFLQAAQAARRQRATLEAARAAQRRAEEEDERIRQSKMNQRRVARREEEQKKRRRMEEVAPPRPRPPPPPPAPPPLPLTGPSRAGRGTRRT